MSEQSSVQPESGLGASVIRCPKCDTVAGENATQCIMCGAELPAHDPVDVTTNEPSLIEDQAVDLEQDPEQVPDIFESILRERKSRSLFWMILGIALITTLISLLVLRDQDAELTLAMVPTSTPLPPTPSYTPTRTPIATETIPPTETPRFTATPAQTDTPQPPRFHSVASGETLFGISLFYRITVGSIADENDIPNDSPIQVGQQLSIPWPTATPPLESMILEVNGEKLIADVTDCEIVTIEEGDSAYGLSAEKDVPAEAIVAVNRLTDESIQLLHPGDTLCVPQIIHGDTLPPTPGPAPTATATSFPSGPNLLYPIEGVVLDLTDEPIALQWAAVKDLNEDEWYMVELGDLDVIDDIPFRAFTRDNIYRLPSSWRPVVPEAHQMRWRISIVKVIGQREDGEFIYGYGGQSSQDAHFSWIGAVPTPTPTSTPIPTETPVP